MHADLTSSTEVTARIDNVVCFNTELIAHSDDDKTIMYKPLHELLSCKATSLQLATTSSGSVCVQLQKIPLAGGTREVRSVALQRTLTTVFFTMQGTSTTKPKRKTWKWILGGGVLLAVHAIPLSVLIPGMCLLMCV